jgi:hypothetical protein
MYTPRRAVLWTTTLLVSTGWCDGFIGHPPAGVLRLRRAGVQGSSAFELASACRSAHSLVPLSAKKSIRDILNEDLEMVPNQPLKGSGGPEEEFELNRGLAIDTLLMDYPYLLESAPDFSIFRREVVLKDAQGFSISGLQAYKLFFTILRRLAQTASGLGVQPNVNVMLMDKYATDKSRIRLRWKIELFQKGQSSKPLSDTERDKMLNKLGFKTPSNDGFNSGSGILEGISSYKLDAKGMISSHTIEVTEPTSMAPLQALQKFFPMGTVPVPSTF